MDQGILYGIVALPEDRRPTALIAAAEGMFTEDLARVLPFDGAAAARYAEIVTARRRRRRLWLQLAAPQW